MSYHHGDLRNALLSAGVELLAERGLDGLSLREAARRAGVSHAAPYRHFADKQALLAAIAEQGFAMLGALVEAAAAAPAAGAAERLRTVLAGYLAFGHAHPHHTELMFGAHAHLKPDSLHPAARATFDGLAALVADAMREADPHDRRDPRTVALALWGQAHGFVTLARHVDFERLVPGRDGATPVEAAMRATADALLARPR